MGINDINEDEIMIEGCFWKWTLSNHAGHKLELALAKKIRCYHFSLKDESLGNCCGERT